MSDTNIYYRENFKRGGLFQLGSTYSVANDGYISISINCLVSDTRWPLPRAGEALSPYQFTIPNLPQNRGIFVVSSTVRKDRGLTYVDLVCSSCLRFQTPRIRVSYETQNFSGSADYGVEVAQGEDPVTETGYWSFTARTPRVDVLSSHLQGERPLEIGVQTGGIALEGGAYGVVYGSGIGWQHFGKGLPYSVDNALGGRFLALANKSFGIEKSISQENDGNVVRSVVSNFVVLR